MLHLCKPHKSVPFFLPCQAQLNDKSFTVQDSQDIELTGVINKADLTLLQIVATFEKQIELKFFRDDVEKKSPFHGPLCEIWLNLLFLYWYKLNIQPINTVTKIAYSQY